MTSLRILFEDRQLNRSQPFVVAGCIVALYAALAMDGSAAAQQPAEVLPTPATSWQTMGLHAAVAGNGCTQAAEVRSVVKEPSRVVVEYALVPKSDQGCFLPPPVTLRAPLGTFAPGAYTVRASGPGQAPFDVQFVVQQPPEQPAYARMQRLSGDRQIILAGATLAPIVVRAVDSTGRPVAGLQLAMMPALTIGGPLQVDEFGFLGFNADLTLTGCCWGVTKPPLPPEQLTTTNADGVATLQPLAYNFAPGSMLFGATPWPNAGSAKPAFSSFVVVESRPQGDARVIVEYFHETRGNYFMTMDDGEIGLLEAGSFTGWKRSIGSFIVYGDSGSPPGTVPVCRFFSGQLASHFYTANPVECDAVVRQWPDVWTLETRSAFRTFVPDDLTGACPANTRPVYRLFNGQAAVNHRYVTDAKLRSAMAAAGWVPEGAGEQGVAMCSPR